MNLHQAHRFGHDMSELNAMDPQHDARANIGEVIGELTVILPVVSDKMARLKAVRYHNQETTEQQREPTDAPNHFLFNIG